LPAWLDAAELRAMGYDLAEIGEIERNLPEAIVERFCSL
jgi:hypothetical protein